MPVKTNTNKTYIYYSPATDVTGKKLAEALSADHGSTLPTGKYDTVICWGAKTSKPVTINATTVVNHPDAIRNNRNKFSALTLMQKAGVNVAPFAPVSDVSKIGKADSSVNLPLIARTSFHQGGKGFWDCPTMTHVKNAVNDGADYLQNLIEIVDEFRVHVFAGTVLYAVRKVKRSHEETAEAFVSQELAKQKGLAEKAGKSFDETTARDLLTRQAKMFAQNGANMLVRSNRLGWKFSRVKALKKEIADEAIKAVKAVGLDFGAVDCCIDATGKVLVLEINSGPGLEETTFDVFVDALKKISSPTQSPQSSVKAVAASHEAVKATNSKTDLLKKLSLASEMVSVADDDEAVVLNNVFKKMFG